MENFLRGHVAAFTAWNGVPRVLLADNLKARCWNAVARQSTSTHCWVLPGTTVTNLRPVAIGRGNGKGRVEEPSDTA
jgi:hypothetical protein